MVEATFCTWTSAEDSTKELFSCCSQDMGAGVPEHCLALCRTECQKSEVRICLQRPFQIIKFSIHLSSHCSICQC